MQKITKKHIESVLRTMDSTKIYEHPYNINSFIVKDMIEMMKEITK